MRLLTSIILCLSLSFTTAYAQDSDTEDFEQGTTLWDLEQELYQLQVDSETITSEAAQYDRYRLPLGRRCTVSGETFQCFDLGEYRLLLEMDVDLKFFTLAYSNALERIEVYIQMVQELYNALDAANAQIETLQAERNRLHQQWTEENRRRLVAENRPAFGNPVAWSLVAGEGVALATLLLVILLGGN